MKKNFIFIICLILLISCNYVENNKNTKQKNDSITKTKLEFVKDSIFKKYVKDSIRKDSLEIERIKAIKSSIKVTSCYLSEPNSASGCDAYFWYVNKSKKTIKYLRFYASFKNGVDDIVICDIRRDMTFVGKDTGPIKPNKLGGGCWDCVIYNWSATKLVIESINIEYIDGSSISINGTDLKLIGLKDKQILN